MGETAIRSSDLLERLVQRAGGRIDVHQLLAAAVEAGADAGDARTVLWSLLAARRFSMTPDLEVSMDLAAQPSPA